MIETGICNGEFLLTRIDAILNDSDMSRKEFAEQLGINPSTMATWKTRNILPSLEILTKISRALNVSIEWLLFGSSFCFIDDTLIGQRRRNQIRDRIYEVLALKLNKDDADNEEDHNTFFGPFESLDFLKYKTLLNWANGIINIDYWVFEEVANVLGVNLGYLFYKPETPSSEDDDVRYKEIVARNYSDLQSLDHLTGERRKTATIVLNQLIQLENLLK